MTKKLDILIYFIIFMACSISAYGEVSYAINPSSGAIASLKIVDDPYSMEWLTLTDGSQYPWVDERYGWGLGFMTLNGNNTNTIKWDKSNCIVNGNNVNYSVDGVNVNVNRYLRDGDLIERFIFSNTTEETIELTDIGVFTPFNDNYPDAATCLTNRTNVHIWEGGNAAYVNAMRMGGTPPHLGLVVTKGAIKGYEILERGLDRQNSQQRGVFALKLPDMILAPGESEVFEWNIFSHSGEDDFRKKAVEKGCPILSSPAYTYCQGNTAKIKVKTLSDNALFSVGDKIFDPVKLSDGFAVEIPMYASGACRVEFEYDGGKVTFAEFIVMPSFEKLIDSRVDFIINHQQMNDKNDPRYGAFMVYDNDGDSIYLNNTRNCNPPDRD